MADKMTFTTTGFEEIRSKMAKLSDEVNYRAGRSSLRKAATILKEQAQQNAKALDDPKTSNEIWANVDLRWNNRAFKRDGVLAFRIGVLGGARQYANTKANIRKRLAGNQYLTGGSSDNPGGNTWYWRFVELGTEHSQAKPFLRPIVDQAGQRAIDEFSTSFSSALDKAIAKASP